VAGSAAQTESAAFVAGTKNIVRSDDSTDESIRAVSVVVLVAARMFLMVRRYRHDHEHKPHDCQGRDQAIPEDFVGFHILS
jgi:hypothetical protein